MNTQMNEVGVPHQVSEAAMGHVGGIELAVKPQQMELFPEGTETITLQ